MISQRERAHLETDAIRLLHLYESGQHASLLNEVDELSKGGGVSPAVMGMAALSLTVLERYAEAVGAAQEAVKREPSQAWLHHTLAAAEACQGRLDAAQEAQVRATRLMPGEPLYVAALARYQRQAGRVAEAVRTARQAAVTHPESAIALAELGLALEAAGDPEAALVQFRLAQQAEPADAAAFLHEGTLHLRAGRRAAARGALREALRRHPGLTEAENRLAETFTGSTGPFRAVVQHLLNLGRVTLVGWLMIGFVYYLFYRLLEFGWKALPPLHPAGRILLLAVLLYLAGGAATGFLLRFAFRRGWVR